MNRFCGLIFCTLFSLPAFNQITGTGMSSDDITTRDRIMVYKILPPVEEKVDLQKSFMKQEWLPGVASFKSGRGDMERPMIFDMDNSKLYYKEGGVIMEFVDTVVEFTLKVPSKNDSVLMKFRKLYPAVYQNNRETYYQVLVDGNYQLVKCMDKNILMIKDMGLTEEKRKEPQAAYFAYLPGKEMVLMAMDNDEIIKRMPEYASRLREIFKKNKLKIKNENKLLDLFIHLNNYSE